MRKILKILLLFQAFIYANSYALIIGVNGNGLVGAENDANCMKTLLIKKDIKNITILKEKNTTKKSIISKFASITKNAKERDYVYLFFSGHGTNENDPNIDAKLKKQLKDTGALIPYGVKKKDYESLIVIKRDLVKYFKELERKKVKTVIIFDACFAGGSFKNVATPKEGYLSLPYNKPTRNNSNYPYKYIVFLSASTKLDTTAESSRKKRGFFSMAVTKCLDKNSNINGLSSCIDKEYQFKGIILPKKSNVSLFPL